MRTTIKNIGRQSPIFDITAGDLSVDMVSDAMNYRLLDNKYISFNGKSLVSSTTSFSPGHINFVQTNSSNFFILPGLNAVKVFNGSTWSDISNVTPYTMTAGDELLWSSCNLGKIPVITNPQGFPEYWSPQNTSQKMQDLKFDAASTWRSKGYRCKIIRAHKTFLFALGLTEGAVEYPNAYRWSHPADVGGLPFSWDPADLSSLASREMVPDEFIIDALSLRDAFLIYTNRGIHMLTYIGGDFVFNSEQISKTHFILSTNCVVEAVGVHYFLSGGDILYNDGTNINSMLDEKIKTYLRSTLSSKYYDNCFAQINPNTKEAWFFIVQDGFQFPNLAVIINYVHNTISLRDIDGATVYATYGPQDIPIDAWSTNALTWDGDTNVPWNSNTSSAPFGYVLISADRDSSSIYSLEALDAVTYNSHVARYNLVLEGVDKETLTIVTRLIPHIKCSGPVAIELGSHDYEGAPVRWKPAIAYNPNGDRKVDIRSTGMLHAWRVSSIGENKFEFSGMDFDYEIVGGRVGG